MQAHSLFSSGIKEKKPIMEEYKKFISESEWRKDGVLYSYVGKPFSSEDEKITLDQFSFFLDRLGEMSQYDVVLLSIGCAGNYRQQQLPDYIREFKKPNKVLVLDIDIEFYIEKLRKRAESNCSLIPNLEAKDRHIYSSRAKNEDLTLEMLACYLPGLDCLHFSQFLENQIRKTMDNQKQVFIANHTQGYSLADIPLIAEIYNRIKQSHSSPALLQLYTQAADAKITYYSNLLYERSESQYRSKESKELLIPNKDNPAFYLSPDIATLSKVSGFQPIQPLKEVDIKDNVFTRKPL